MWWTGIHFEVILTNGLLMETGSWMWRLLPSKCWTDGERKRRGGGVGLARACSIILDQPLSPWLLPMSHCFTGGCCCHGNHSWAPIIDEKGVGAVRWREVWTYGVGWRILKENGRTKRGEMHLEEEEEEWVCCRGKELQVWNAKRAGEWPTFTWEEIFCKTGCMFDSFLIILHTCRPIYIYI